MPRSVQQISFNLFVSFYDQKNDYNNPVYQQSDLVDVHYSGHPGDSPRDIRSRQIFVEWSTHNHKPPAEANIAAPVFRASLYCNGRCMWGSKEASVKSEDSDELKADGTDSDEPTAYGHDSEIDEPSKRHAGRSKCPRKAKMVVSASRSHAACC